ncbi:MAG: tRNA-(ms[2]io[6]A)-hydroxylase [Flavobacteriales bacterium]|nr:tRNA-(ms[2]io[6]A)-hydroxylase [Flavobacteriales bacterium]
MLGLKLRTDPRWVDLIENNLEMVLSDHAWCEKKAASNAIALLTYNSHLDDLVDTMTAIAIEEMQHFDMVIKIIRDRGYNLLMEEKDCYVNELYKFMKKDGSRTQALSDRLLFAAMVEARSCERFKTLSENIKDEELAKFYRDLMVSEANHYTTFLNFARKYGSDVDVEKRWQEWLEYEDQVIQNYGKKETVHG